MKKTRRLCWKWAFEKCALWTKRIDGTVHWIYSYLAKANFNQYPCVSVDTMYCCMAPCGLYSWGGFSWRTYNRVTNSQDRQSRNTFPFPYQEIVVVDVVDAVLSKVVLCSWFLAFPILMPIRMEESKKAPLVNEWTKTKLWVGKCWQVCATTCMTWNNVKHIEKKDTYLFNIFCCCCSYVHISAMLFRISIFLRYSDCTIK